MIFRKLLLIVLSVSIVLLTGCSDDEVDPDSGNNNGGAPNFELFDFTGSNVSVVDIEAGTNVSYVLLSDGTVWLAGLDPGLTDDDSETIIKTANYIKIYDNAKAISAGYRQIAIIENDGTLVINRGNTHDGRGNSEWVEIDQNVKSIQKDYIFFLSYITEDNSLYVNVELLPDSIKQQVLGADRNLKFEFFMEDVKDFTVFTQSQSPHYSIVKTDGSLLQSDGRDWSLFSDLYVQNLPLIDGFYQTATGLNSVEQNITVTVGVKDDGTLVVTSLPQSGNNGQNYWSEVNFDKGGEVYNYPNMGNVNSIIANEVGALIIKENGELLATGYNNQGMFGNGSSNQIINSPISVYNGVNDATIGNGHSHLILNNGGTKGSGNNGAGQLGDGTFNSKLGFDDQTSTPTGDVPFLGIWSLENGSTITFNSEGTGRISQVDVNGICGPTLIDFTWKTGGSIPPGHLTLDYEEYTICANIPGYAQPVEDFPETDPIPFSVSVSGNQLTLNGQVWSK